MSADTPPLYQSLAAQIRAQILSGAYAPGDHLPTEHELCDAHGVSRHTAREALRLLQEDGLIARRRGAGTVVADAPTPRSFSQPIGDFDAILQYAREARLEILATGPFTPLNGKPADLSGTYVRYEGLRRIAGQPPIAHTVVCALEALAPPLETARGLDGSFAQWIEHTHGVTAETVVQRFSGAHAPTSVARQLAMDEEAPALRTTRRYLDASGRVFLLSDSLHPADRFGYEMRLQRTRTS